MKNYRDDFKVRFTKKPQYTIDEAKKTVKCYLTCDVIVPTGISGNQFMYNFRTFAKGYAKCDDNNDYRKELESAGLRIGGTSPDESLVEMVELPEHPFYVGCQFHPEFKSRPFAPHPLFVGLVEAALKHQEK